MNKLLGVAGVVGAGALAKRFMDRRGTRRYDEEYSAVSTETPPRTNRNKLQRNPRSRYTESEFTESMTDVGRHGRHSPLLPGPGNPVATAAALSAAEARPNRPVTPRPSHSRPENSRLDSVVTSDYSSYVSPSRRGRDEKHSGGVGKGLLAGLGLGWLASKMGGRKERRAEEERLAYEEDRRSGHHGSRYTGDGHGSPRKVSRRRPPRTAATATTMTADSELSAIEPRPTGVVHGGPPMPPLGPAGAGPSPIVPVHGSHSRHDIVTPVAMPPIPTDPHGILHREESGSESYMSTGGRPHRRHSSRRRREGEQAAATAAATAGLLATEEAERRRRNRSQSRAPSQPVSVKVKYHDDRDRNITLRRLTEEEAAREQRRQRSNSVSSLEGGEASSGRRRYRRDSSARRAGEDTAAERLASEPLSPPTPAFAGGRRPPAKDSAYYSGAPGPSAAPVTPMHGNQTVSSIGSPGSYGTHSAMSPSPSGPLDSATASAADRRRRRRLERRDQRPQTGTVEFS